MEQVNKNTIIELLNFQLLYLNRLVDNIPNERLYEKQLEGFNSAGWILGHICVEADDVIRQLPSTIPFEKLDSNWEKWFRNSTGKIQEFIDLPSKEVLISTLNKRYKKLGNAYVNVSTVQRNGPHPSRLLNKFLTTFDAWFAHHLVPHIAMHCGNIVVWKKMIGIEVNGF